MLTSCGIKININMYIMGDIHISMLFLLQISVPAALLYGALPSSQQSQMPASKDLYLLKI